MAKKPSKKKPGGGTVGIAPERAREDDGQYKADNPDTPDVNEAWADGEGPDDSPEAVPTVDAEKGLSARVISIGVFDDGSPDRYQVIYHQQAGEIERQHAFPAGQEVAVGDCVRSLLQELI